MSADTEALLATVREALEVNCEEHFCSESDVNIHEEAGPCYAHKALAALDSLTAELAMMRDHIEHREEQLRARPEQLAEALFAAEAELERVKAERDEALVIQDYDGSDIGVLVHDYRKRAEVVGAQLEDAVRARIVTEARLDRALSALREIAEMSEAKGGHAKYGTVARAAIAEIEGDPEWKQQKC